MSLLRRNVVTAGHRLLFVHERGPGAKAGLVPFLDLITAVEGKVTDDGENSLVALISPRIDTATELTVYNIKTKTTRKTHITPTRTWGGVGVLGVVARYDAVDVADKRFMVTALLPGGPADESGLRANEDFILGSDDMTVRSEAELTTLFTGGAKRVETSSVSEASAPSTAPASGAITPVPVTGGDPAAPPPSATVAESVTDAPPPAADAAPFVTPPSSAPPSAPATPSRSSPAHSVETRTAAMLLRSSTNSHESGTGSVTGSVGTPSSAAEPTLPSVILLYVYNGPSDTVRTVALVPSKTRLAPHDLPADMAPTKYGSQETTDSVASGGRRASLEGGAAVSLDERGEAVITVPSKDTSGAVAPVAEDVTPSSVEAASETPVASSEVPAAVEPPVDGTSVGADASAVPAEQGTATLASGDTSQEVVGASSLTSETSEATATAEPATPATGPADVAAPAGDAPAETGASAPTIAPADSKRSLFGSNLFAARKAALDERAKPAAPAPAPIASAARVKLGGGIAAASAALSRFGASTVSAASSLGKGVAQIGSAIASSESVKAAGRGVSAVKDSASRTATSVGSGVADAAKRMTTAPNISSIFRGGKRPVGVWYDHAGVRVQVLTGMPHASTTGRWIGVQDDIVQDASARARLYKLGVGDLFARLTGMSPAAIAAAIHAAHAAAAAAAEQKDKAVGAMAAATAGSVPASAGGSRRGSQTSVASGGSDRSLTKSGAEGAAGGSAEGDDSDDDKPLRRRVGRPPLKPRHATRGARKKASEDAARAKARAMGMSVIGGDAGAASDSDSTPAEVEAAEAQETATAAAVAAADASKEKRASGFLGSLLGSGKQEDEPDAMPADMPLWETAKATPPARTGYFGGARADTAARAQADNFALGNPLMI